MIRLNRHRPANNSPSWSLQSLEPRLLLAGDAGAAIEGPVDVAEVTKETSVTRTTPNLVFVDPTVPDLETMLDGIDASYEIVLLDPKQDGIPQISRVLAGHREIQSIHVITHGESGAIKVGANVVDEGSLVRMQSEIRAWSRSLAADADILLYGCESGKGDLGAGFVRRLASLTGADVAASDDVTGNASLSGDWDLETTVGLINSGLAFNTQVQRTYQGTLPISIRAAGVTNEEQLLLQVQGQTVATFDNVGGDAYAGQYQTYTYNVDGISANDVRLVFTNDLYDEANNIDRNVRVDDITIDGVTFETEASSVYSTGTWLPADGVVPGFRQNEFLHTNGYFQFAEDASGSLIQISAAGSTGQEIMQLEIDGTVVQTWTGVSSTDQIYSYRADQTVTVDQIRVSFTNDLYDPANNVDRNLTVDNLSIDGVTFDTESTDVFSTGTWLSEDGITDGFGRGDTLHTNGYFQYGSEQTNPGTIGLTLESLTIDEDLGTLNIIVFREGGADGTVTVDYTTNVGTADGTDFESISGTLTFDDGSTGQQLALQINDDGLVEADETFSLSLSNATGGAELGSITTQAITIRDNDEPVVGVIFEDSFEGSANWTTNAFGSDTATTGQWAIGSPESTSANGVQLQLNSGHTGSRSLVTGLAAGGSAGVYDIDSGATSVLSPEIQLPAGTEIELSFSYYLAYLNNASNDDYFEVAIIADGVETEIYDDHAHSANQAATWQDVEIDISQYAGQTIQIQFEAADALGASLVEAAVDDVVVEALPNLPGTINIATTGVNIDEATGVATVVVQRTSGRNGAVTVDYQTNTGTAGSSDFVEASGTLTFADGVSEQTIAIDINDDTVEEDLESFTLQINNASGGAVLGSDTTATITIADNDSTTPDYLPDMVPVAATLLQNLSVDTSEIPGRELLRFSTEVGNAGDGPLEIWGGTVSGNSQQVFQRIYQADGGFRDQLAGEFVYHPGHGHIHFEGFATYNLNLTDPSGNTVASGGKTSFCLINIRQPFTDATANAGVVHGRGGTNCGNVQGISTGYSDVYSASLDDQWIDITDVADGQYWLEIIADPDNNIQETDETNNTARVLVTIANGEVSY